MYKCTDDSKSAEAFHESCDEIGPTLTVIRCTDGYVFGGYNPGSWKSGWEDGRAENAFLFSLVNPADTAPTKYNVTDPDRAVFNSDTGGPVFGWDDICCWDGSDESYIYFPQSYEDTTGRGVQTFTGGDIRVHSAGGPLNGSNVVLFVIDRLEVWSVV